MLQTSRPLFSPPSPVQLLDEPLPAAELEDDPDTEEIEPPRVPSAAAVEVDRIEDWMQQGLCRESLPPRSSRALRRVPEVLLAAAGLFLVGALLF